MYEPGDVVLGGVFCFRRINEVSEEVPRPFGGQFACDAVAYLSPIGAAELLRM